MKTAEITDNLRFIFVWNIPDFHIEIQRNLANLSEGFNVHGKSITKTFNNLVVFLTLRKYTGFFFYYYYLIKTGKKP